MLDEDRIARALTDPTVVLTPNGIRSLMSLVLMACYDRKVAREFMAEMLDHAAEVGMILAKMEGGAKLRAAMALLKKDVPVPQIDEELAGLVKAWNAQKVSIATKFDLVRHQATTLDTIN